MDENECNIVRELGLDTKLACIITASGRALWVSRLWADNPREVLGEGWQGFVHHEDLAGVLAWLADGREGDHEFRALHPATGGWIVTKQAKLRIRCGPCVKGACVGATGHWLTIASNVTTADPFPTPDPPNPSRRHADDLDFDLDLDLDLGLPKQGL